MIAATDMVLKKCHNCRIGNRLPSSRVQDNPLCGRCGLPLFAPETVFLGFVPARQKKSTRTEVPRKHMSAETRQRKGLLAKWHIAIKDLGLKPDEKEAILRGFKVESAADMSIPQLERLVKYLKKLGWKPVRRRGRGHVPEARRDRYVSPEKEADRLTALRTRCEEIARMIENGEKRLAGLTQKICGVSNIAWCRDAAKLERLLAVLGKIKSTESATKQGTCTGSP